MANVINETTTETPKPRYATYAKANNYGRAVAEWYRTYSIRAAERVYLPIALLFGILLCFVTPPFMVADEGSHFYRAFEISEGHLLSTRFDPLHTGGMLPATLFNTAQTLIGGMASGTTDKVHWDRMQSALLQPLHPEDRIQTLYQCQSLYSPLPYLPAAFGIWLGRQAAASPLVLMYLARVFTCVAAMLLTALAIRLTPFFKWAVATLMLIPLVFFQTASVSADALTFSLCFLFVAACWYLCSDPRARLTGRNTVLVGLAAAGMCLAKQAYFPMISLLAFIPASTCGGSQKEKWLKVAAIAAFGLGLMAAWGVAAQSVWVPARLDIPVDPQGQVRYVLANPTEFWHIFSRTWVRDRHSYFFSMFGSALSWFDLKIPNSDLNNLIWAFGLIILFDGQKNRRVGLPLRIFCAALTGAMVVLLITWQYLSWDTVGAPFIDGPTGRYLVPLLPLLMILPYNRILGPVTRAERWLPLVVTVFGVYSGIVVVSATVRRFYNL